jgi:hypothetical protein
MSSRGYGGKRASSLKTIALEKNIPGISQNLPKVLSQSRNFMPKVYIPLSKELKMPNKYITCVCGAKSCE